MLKPPRPPARRPKPVRIGPEDHGRRMTLDVFDRAVGREGYLYELAKGVIEVTDVPEFGHALQVQAVRDQFTAHRLANPGVIFLLAGSHEAKILLTDDNSERHPDLSVYLSPPPTPNDRDVWSLWVPEIVIEVVSRRSGRRDYEEKPQEYLDFGVREYWIVDVARQQMTVMTRWRGAWKSKVVKPSQKFATPLLPGFALDVKRVLAAGRP